MLDNGLKPDTHTFSALIVSYARKRDTNSVQELLNQMKETKVPLNDITFAICAHAHYTKDPDSFWKGLDMLCDTYATSTCGPTSRIFHPWLHSVMKSVKSNSSLADPRSINIILEQIRRLPVFRKGLSHETWIVALDILHKMLNSDTSNLTSSCIHTLLRQMALSDMSAPASEHLKKWSRHVSNDPVLSQMYNRIIDKETNLVTITNTSANSSIDKEITKIDNLFKDTLLDLEKTSIHRLWCDVNTTSKIGNGGFKTVLGVEIENKTYALVLPNSMYENNIGSTVSTKSESSSDWVTDDDDEDFNDTRSILQELEPMHELRNTKHVVRVAFKFRGLPIFALELCALQSLKSFVRSSSSGFNWHSQIVPNLPFALELFLGTLYFFF